MAIIKGQPYRVRFRVWDTTTNQFYTGDASNISVRISKDGGALAATTNPPTRVDAAYSPGNYEVLLTASEMNANSIHVAPTGPAGTICQTIDLLTDQGYVTAIRSQTDMLVFRPIGADNAVQAHVAAIDNNVISAGTIADGTITAAKLADGAITSSKISDNAITSTKIADNAITASKIATDAITAAKIAADAIGASELATDAVQEIVSAILSNPANKLLTDASGRVTVAGYATGQSPAEQVLSTPANKLATDTSGRVTVGGYATGQSPADLVLSTPANKLATNASGHVTVGGYASGQTPADHVLSTPANKLATDTSGRVTVGAYASGQSPADLVLSTPANKLATDTSGRVTVGSILDTAVDAIWNRLRSAVSRPAGSFGDYLDMKVSQVSGGGGGGADWTVEERKQIRAALGITGETATPDSSGYVSQILSKVTPLNFTSGNVHARVEAYGTLLSPSEQVLATPANKLATTSSGHVTVGGYASGQSPADYILVSPTYKLQNTSAGEVNINMGQTVPSSPVTGSTGDALRRGINNLNATVSSRAAPGDQMALIDNAITAAKIAADAITAAKIAADAIGASELATDAVQEIASAILSNPAYKLSTNASGQVQLDMTQAVPASPTPDTVGDALKSAATLDFAGTNVKSAPQTPVTVGGYASGQSPADYVLVAPSYKLSTDAQGRVQLQASEHTAVQSDVQQAMTGLGYTGTRATKLDYLDASITSRAAAGSAMTLTEAERDAIASAVLVKPLDSVEALATVKSLAWGLAKILNKVETTGSNLVVYKTDNVTAWYTQVLTLTGQPVNISGLSEAT